MYYRYGLAYVILHIIWWVIIIALVIWLVRLITGGRHHRFPRHNDALDILRERYAKGEISKEEFEERKKNLLT